MSGVTMKRTSNAAEKSPALRKIKVVETTPTISLDASDFHKMEDEIARSTTHAELEKSFLAESTMLRAALQKVIDGDDKPLSPDVLLNIIRMRRYSRLAHYATAQLRAETMSRLEQVEAKYLHLQNSSSEIQHLQKEISRCLQFSAGDEEIDLVPLEEFYASAPESISRPEVTKTNEHEQRLARLTWEIAQRKALLDTLTEQEGRRNVLTSSINGKEQRLKSLRSKISTLMTAAKPVQEALGVGNASASSAEQRSLFSLLPHDLSVLYVQAEAYRDIMEDSDIQVVIRGDANEALRLRRQVKEEVDEREKSDDDEASDSEGRHNVVSDRLELNKKTVTQPHPIYLKIDIGCQDDVKVALKLHYIQELRVTCMKYKVTGKLPTHGGVSAPENLLDGLFSGDDGTECPNPVGAAKLQQLKIGVDSFANKYGRPYRFVQALTGSASLTTDGVPSEVETSGIHLADVLHDVVKAIRDRVAARVKLVRQLLALESSPMDALRSTDIPLKMITHMVSFKMIDEETFMSSVTPELRTLALREGGAFYFMASLENKIADVSIITYVMIPVDYPKQIPLLAIAITFLEDKDLAPRTLTAANSHIVKALERYVNIECIKQEFGDVSTVLTRQLAHLASRCDVVVDLVPQFSTGDNTQRQHLYSRLSRGRDDDLPFSYSSSTSAFAF
ncbi:hypothetical protein KIN20_023083 [Parelaphostrongylus tenuis]|uniref:THO complex subunit 5 n=1 Tax=Parelaphostrongylus tenuis TaxID=148309 RepID=A0AAD5N8N1_PARTN|nr:hypothetical protein KIN20_023083 [Parelaphostrongylus tenuis]